MLCAVGIFTYYNPIIQTVSAAQTTVENIQSPGHRQCGTESGSGPRLVLVRQEHACLPKVVGISLTLCAPLTFRCDVYIGLVILALMPRQAESIEAARNISKDVNINIRSNSLRSRSPSPGPHRLIERTNSSASVHTHPQSLTRSNDHQLRFLEDTGAL